MQLTSFVLLAGVLGAAAHPSAHGHGHLHRSAHVKRDAPAYVKNVHVKPIPKPTTTQAPPPPPPTTAAAPPKPTDVGSAVAGLVNEFVSFCGSGKSKRVTDAQVMYTGDTGAQSGCAWGSNLMQIAEQIADKYQYVQKFTNVASEPYQVVCGNKIGADGQLTGMVANQPNQKQLIFTLAPGETRNVAAAADSQGVCAWAPQEVPVAPNGQYAGVWGEFDFGDAQNKGWSGADCSALVAQAYGLPVPGCKMSHGGIDSTILPGGQATNAYIKGMEKADGIGLNIYPGNVVIDVKVGFSG